MAIESFETKGYQSIIANMDESAFSDYTEKVVLDLAEDGSDTAIAGLVVAYNTADSGDDSTGAGTDAAIASTHRTVGLATTGDPVTDEAHSFAGIILRPAILPENYGLDDTITDGELVVILRPTGGKAIVRGIYADANDDVLPGNILSMATGGKLKKTTWDFSATLTDVKIQNAVNSLAEKVGVADAVAEDVPGTDIIVHMRY